MKTTWTLRTFVFTVTILCLVVCLTCEHLILGTTKLEQVVMGPVTAGLISSSETLTVAELEFAIAKQERVDGSRRTLNLENISIEELNTSVDAPRDVPLLGYAELHRTIYKCVVEEKCDRQSSEMRTYLVEKNHFHMLTKTPNDKSAN